jgi:hypothetical protein
MIEFGDPRLWRRFWEKVAPPNTDGCWLWTAAKRAGGYGVVQHQWERRVAHRASYEELVGPIPDGHQLDHICRVRNCVNPAHLEPVTHKENVQRGNAGLHKKNQTECKRGHPFSDENVYVSHGVRKCRICSLAREKTRYQSRKAAVLEGRKTDG